MTVKEEALDNMTDEDAINKLYETINKYKDDENMCLLLVVTSCEPKKGEADFIINMGVRSNLRALLFSALSVVRKVEEVTQDLPSFAIPLHIAGRSIASIAKTVDDVLFSSEGEKSDVAE